MTVRTIVGDAIARLLPEVPDGSVQTCVTSPPYWGLRSYLPADHPAKSLELGCERDPQEYIDRLVAAFREVRRTLTKTGTLWVNLGDCYTGGRDGDSGSVTLGGGRRTQEESRKAGNRKGARPFGLAAKQLIMMPERVAMALQADGWWLRSKIVWAKSNGMPGSQTDRPTTSYEHVFLLSQSARYFYDNRAIRLPLMPSSAQRLSQVLDGQKGSERANGQTRTDRPMKAVRFGGTKYAANDSDEGSGQRANERLGANGGGAAEPQGSQRERERERERERPAGRGYSGNEWRPSGSGL